MRKSVPICMTNSSSNLELYFVERISGTQDLPFFPDHLARYRFAMQWAPRSRILDVCCGVGYGSVLLAASGAARVLGIDISAAAISLAEQQHGPSHLTFQQGDACLPYPNTGSWDLVTCFEGIEHVKDPKALLKNVYNALADGGVAILSSPNSDGCANGHSGNPFHPSEMKEAEFRSLINDFAWKVEWYGQIAKESIWRRPSWQRFLIRLLPTALRPGLRNQPTTGNPSVRLWRKASDGGKAIEVWRQSTDDWYPMPWDATVKIMYNPPPGTILAVCRRIPTM